MAIEFNHTLIACRDKHQASAFMAEILEAGDREFQTQHYAFLISEDEFDEIFGRIRERALDFWADPFLKQAGEINHRDGGRGVYFRDPDGHLLEVLTRPYGSGGG